MKRIAVAAVSFACMLATNALAQPLVERVPQDAVAYFGWAGANSLAEQYSQTHLKAVLDETRMRDLFGRYLNEVEARLVKQEPKAKEPFRLARLLGAPVWKYPAALIVGKADFSNLEKPEFRLALVSQAGADSAKLSEELNALLASAPEPPVPVKIFTTGDVVCVAIGYETAEMALAGEGSGRPGSLAQASPFKEALKQVSAKPALITFINAEAIVATAEQALEANDAEMKAKVSTFLESSGLRGVKSYISTAGFDGKDWVNQSFTNVPGERIGLFAAMPSGPTDAALLKTVPMDATFFVSTRFDTAKFVRAMRDSLGKTDEQALQYFNMGLSGMQQALGTNVLDNLLEPLGHDWAVFTSPRTGSGILGMVAVNKLDDPDKMKKGLMTASINLTNWINVAIRKGDGGKSGVSIRGASTKIGGVDVNYLATPIFAPSWAISNGQLFVGLYPQSVGAAARQAAKGSPSIFENPKYQAVLKRLGNATPESSSFYDLETSASYGSMYPQMMLLARYAGFGDLFGVTLPEPLLPPMDVLLDHLTPAGSVSWSDSAGFHSKSVTPFPGAMIVTEQGAIASVGAGSGGLMASILLPSLNRARETANRVKSASNLRQIGTAIALYANENRGKYPPDLGTLIATQDLVPVVFDNPRAADDEPPVPNVPMQELSAYINENSDYVYVGQDMNNSAPADAIVAYENPEGLEDGINILFGDGHVEFVMMERAMQMIEAGGAGL